MKIHRGLPSDRSRGVWGQRQGRGKGVLKYCINIVRVFFFPGSHCKDRQVVSNWTKRCNRPRGDNRGWCLLEVHHSTGKHRYQIPFLDQQVHYRLEMRCRKMGEFFVVQQNMLSWNVSFLPRKIFHKTQKIVFSIVRETVSILISNFFIKMGLNFPRTSLVAFHYDSSFRIRA